METILLHGITTEEFFEKIRTIIKEEIKAEMKQDQLIIRDGALKIAGIGNAKFLKAINEGILNLQLVKGRNRAMYLETEVINRVLISRNYICCLKKQISEKYSNLHR